MADILEYVDYNVKLDIIKDYKPKEDIVFVQNNRDSAKMSFTFTKNNKAINMSDVTEVVMAFHKPDGTLVWQGGATPVDPANGVYLVVLRTQVLAAIGKVLCHGHFLMGGKVIETRQMFFQVEKSFMSDSTVESTDDFPLIYDAIEAAKLFEGVDVPGIISAGERADTAINGLKAKATVINVSGHTLFNSNDVSVAINDIIKTCPANSYIYLEHGAWRGRTIELTTRKSFTLDIKGSVELVTDKSLFRVKNNLPMVINLETALVNVATAGTGTSCLEVWESYHGTFNIKSIQNFDTGIALVPNKVTTVGNEGVQYCKFNFDQIRANSVGILFSCGTSGLPWVNENTFTGGRILGIDGIKFTKGSVQIDPYNNNRFYNVGCEYLSGNAIDIQYASNNNFENFRYEGTAGFYIKETGDCFFNKFRSAYPAPFNKLSSSGKESIYDFTILTSGGAHGAFKRITNNYKNSSDLNFALYDGNIGNTVSYMEGINKPYLDRYAFILRSGNEVIRIPARESSTKYSDNVDFTMDYLYRDTRILSNNKAVTVTIPDKFKYDGAEFRFSTNWNTNDIIFVSETGTEHFRVKNSDGLGTWSAIYIPSKGSFSPLKLTTAVRPF